ncbi:hypothetical protein NQ176_g5431 [Zarea fungicola]|uniref:Uncharacterized protein n=1 Tax=Zarea fungicola TaxID=93591 RepID=A0ACC1N8J3_9HYPO|nr:hypothetical protein NQ176_g5431 [Lecanicillium fungicola]
MSRLLHIVFFVLATLGFCLTAQQLHNIHDMGTPAHLGHRAPHYEQQQQQRQRRQDTSSTDYYKSEKPTSVQDAPSPPPAQTASITILNRDMYSGSPSDDAGSRLTKIKTPAAEKTSSPQTNTKVPVVMSGATSLLDPGFVALAASLGLMTLGMALI